MALLKQPAASNSQNSSRQWVSLSRTTFPVQTSSESYDAGRRVCDNCRVKKRKCDFGQPSCEACQAKHLPCAYTWRRKKPGPSKGSYNKVKRKEASDHNGLSHTYMLSQPTAGQDCPVAAKTMVPKFISRELDQDLFLEQPNLGDDSKIDTDQGNWPNIQILTLLGSSTRTKGPGSSGTSLSSELKLHLLNLYFEYIQPMYPLFQRKALLERHFHGNLEASLEMIMFALAARYSPWLSEISKCLGVEAHQTCASLAARSESAHHAALGSVGNDFTLSQVQVNFLLCIYDLALGLDRRAWVQVGQLTRIAYICGLDQIESREACIFYQPGVTTEAEMEEWRHLWWNIWRLDSTANSLNSSPCSTDTSVPGTALVSTSAACLTDGNIVDSVGRPRLYLNCSVSSFWKTLQPLLEDSTSCDINLHTAAYTLIREATAIQRLTRYQRNTNSEARLLDLDKTCAAAQLALPLWYSNPARSISMGESAQRHVDRLRVLLIITCARLMATLCASRIALAASNLAQFQEAWQECLSSCQRVVHIVQHFDPGYLWSLDPIIGWIPWLAGVLFMLEVVASPLFDELSKERLLRNVELTILFLRQIGNHWNIGLVLAESLENLTMNRHRYKAASYADLLPLFSQLEMPLNRRTRIKGSLPAYESATNPFTVDSMETIDPLGFFTFENSGYDQQVDFDNSWSLDEFLCG